MLTDNYKVSIHACVFLALRVCVHVCVCERERERERERESLIPRITLSAGSYKIQVVLRTYSNLLIKGLEGYSLGIT